MLPQRCAEDAAQWFKRNYSKPEDFVDSPEGGSSPVAIEYENHYSRTKIGCFLVLSQLTMVRNAPHAKSRHSIVLTHTLWNVNDNAKLGAYVVQNVEVMSACAVADAVCTSKGQWLEMVRPFIVE